MIEPIVCPTVLATDAHTFRSQIDRISSFASRIQIDLMDGEFASPKSVSPIQVWWPETLKADIHLMFQHPINHLETLVALDPNMVILHAEADNVAECIDHLRQCGMSVGLAVLPETTIGSVSDLIQKVDHVLIFGGSLGSFGGNADLSQLEKVSQIRQISNDIEIGWDGGANNDNVVQLIRSGIDVVNVGGAIQRSENPSLAYDTIKETIRIFKEQNHNDNSSA